MAFEDFQAVITSGVGTIVTIEVAAATIKAAKRLVEQRTGRKVIRIRAVVYKTSKVSGHRHKWKRKNKFTSKNAGHRHRINIRKRLAMPHKKRGHKHRLLKRR